MRLRTTKVVSEYGTRTEKEVLTAEGYAALTIASFLALFALIIMLMFFFKWYDRYQARADANNHVKVSAIQIRNQEQRVKIAKQQAQIRFQRAVGVRHAQDEIAKTLTPLYVKFEMIDALRQIAQSGSNSSVIYIPTGADGLAAVPTINAGTGK